MSIEAKDLVKAINRVYDELWITDLEEAYQYAKKALELLDFGRYSEVAYLTKDLLRSLRQQAKQMETRKVKGWISEKVSEELEMKRLSPQEVLRGLLAIKLQNLEELISYELEVIKSKREATPNIIKKQDYKYCVFPQYPRYEVRSVFYVKPRLPELNQIERFCSDFGLRPSNPERLGASMVIRLFSQDEVLEVIVHPYIAHIIATLREPNMERVTNIAEALFNMLTR